MPYVIARRALPDEAIFFLMRRLLRPLGLATTYLECFDDSVTLLLANQSLSFQISSPNKKARLNFHRAFVRRIKTSSQNLTPAGVKRVYHALGIRVSPISNFGR